MKGEDQILNFDDQTKEVSDLIRNADLIFCLDYNSGGRIGRMEEVMQASHAKKIMIDHHQNPDTAFYNIIFSNPGNSSTSQLIFELIDARNDLNILDSDIGTPLYAGIMMDTGSFRFPSTSAKTHEIIGQLIKAGVKHWLVHKNIHDTNTVDRLKLVSFALLEKLTILGHFSTAYIALDQPELERFNADKGDTEGLVNQILSIKGIKLAVFFKNSDGIIKISFRSKGSIPVNELASTYFDGGGHRNASGGKFQGKINKAVEKFEQILPAFYKAHLSEFES